MNLRRQRTWMAYAVCGRTPDANGLNRVSFKFVLREIVGTIIAVRGPIGIGGRRLFEITAPQDWADLILKSLSEDEFKLLD